MITRSAPLVSVCIPVHNCAAYIDQAIESVLAQTMSDWELVILDNASSDGTVAIARSYTDHRIRIVENVHNIGLEANWNKALEKSRGDYVKLLPADDYLLPRCLETQVGALALEVNRKAVLACCGRRIVSPAGDTLLTRRFSRGEGLIRVLRPSARSFDPARTFSASQERSSSEETFLSARGRSVHPSCT